MTSSAVTGRPLFLGSPSPVKWNKWAFALGVKNFMVTPCPGSHLAPSPSPHGSAAGGDAAVGPMGRAVLQEGSSSLRAHRPRHESPEAPTPSLLFFWKRPFGSSDV